MLNTRTGNSRYATLMQIAPPLYRLQKITLKSNLKVEELDPLNGRIHSPSIGCICTIRYAVDHHNLLGRSTGNRYKSWASYEGIDNEL